MDRESFNGNAPQVQSSNQSSKPFTAQQQSGEPVHDRVMRLREALRENIANGVGVDEDGKTKGSLRRGFFRFRKPSMFRPSADARVEDKFVSRANLTSDAHTAELRVAPADTSVVDKQNETPQTVVAPVQPTIADMRNIIPRIEVIAEPRFSAVTERKLDEADRIPQRISLRHPAVVEEARPPHSAMVFAETGPELRKQENLSIYQVADAPSIFLESQSPSVAAELVVDPTPYYPHVAEPTAATAADEQQESEDSLLSSSSGHSQVEWPAEWQTTVDSPNSHATVPDAALQSVASLGVAAPPIPRPLLDKGRAAGAPALEVPDWLSGAEADRIRRLVATFRELVEQQPASVMSPAEIEAEANGASRPGSIPSMVDLDVMDQAQDSLTQATDSKTSERADQMPRSTSFNGHLADAFRAQGASTSGSVVEPQQLAPIFKHIEVEATSALPKAVGARTFEHDEPFIPIAYSEPAAQPSIPQPKSFASLENVQLSPAPDPSQTGNLHFNETHGKTFLEPSEFSSHKFFVEEPASVSQGSVVSQERIDMAVPVTTERFDSTSAADRNGAASVVVRSSIEPELAVPLAFCAANEEVTALADKNAAVNVNSAPQALQHSAPAAVQSIPAMAWRPAARNASSVAPATLGRRPVAPERSDAPRFESPLSNSLSSFETASPRSGLYAPSTDVARGPASRPPAVARPVPIDVRPSEMPSVRTISAGARKPPSSIPNGVSASQALANRTPRRWHMLSRFDPGVPAAELMGVDSPHDLTTQRRSQQDRVAG